MHDYDLYTATTEEVFEATERISRCPTRRSSEAGTLILGLEKMRYQRESGTSLRVTLRGVDTYATMHAMGDVVVVQEPQRRPSRPCFSTVHGLRPWTSRTSLSYSGAVRGSFLCSIAGGSSAP